MAIYQLFLDGEVSWGGAILPATVDDPIFFSEFFTGQRLPGDFRWPELQVIEGDLGYPDIAVGSRAAPLVTSDVRKVLEQHCSQDDIEYVPVEAVSDPEYFAVNVIRVVDCLDHDKSDFSISVDGGRILFVKKHVFDESQIGNDVMLFKIPEELNVVYVTERFAELAAKNQWTGIYVKDADAFAVRDYPFGLPVRPYRSLTECSRNVQPYRFGLLHC